MIQRKKLTIFTDAKDNTNIYEVKKMIEGLYDNLQALMEFLENSLDFAFCSFEHKFSILSRLIIFSIFSQVLLK